MKKIGLGIALLMLATIFAACDGGNSVQNQPATPPPAQQANNAAPGPTVAQPSDQNTSQSSGQPPDHITVQHILIGFKDAVGFQGKPPPKAQTRTQDQAKALAYDLLAKAKGGADFDALVVANTDDSPPGIYSMANTGVAPSGANEYQREGMVPAFGNVGFALKVGEIGIADYDPQTSPFGYHIIKRIK